MDNVFNVTQAVLTGWDVGLSREWRAQDRTWRAEDLQWREHEREIMRTERKFMWVCRAAWAGQGAHTDPAPAAYTPHGHPNCRLRRLSCLWDHGEHLPQARDSILVLSCDLVLPVQPTWWACSDGRREDERAFLHAQIQQMHLDNARAIWTR